MEWFRWYHGTVADPKFSIIAKRSKQPRHVVIACWPAILEFASSRDDRGCLAGLDMEEVAVVLDLELEQVEAVFQAMIDKDMVDADTAMLVNWRKRQPLREDATATERKKRFKEKKEQEQQQQIQPVAQGERTGTQKNARNGQEQNRTEQIKEKEKPALTTELIISPDSAQAPLVAEASGRDTLPVRLIKEAVNQNQKRLGEMFPHADIAVETEKMCVKYRAEPVLDAYLLVLSWFQKIPVPSGIRQRLAGLTVAEIEAGNDAIVAEFVNGGVG